MGWVALRHSRLCICNHTVCIEGSSTASCLAGRCQRSVGTNCLPGRLDERHAGTSDPFPDFLHGCSDLFLGKPPASSSARTLSDFRSALRSCCFSFHESRGCAAFRHAQETCPSWTYRRALDHSRSLCRTPDFVFG